MAKVGLYLKGASGKLAGAVLAKGANGETIIRDLVKPANPQTDAQATQRMKMAAVCNFYRGLASILDHSFENVKYGNDSRMYFMKLALSNPLSVAAIEKGTKEFTPLPLVISTGSLNSVRLVNENPEFIVKFTHPVTTEEAAAINDGHDSAIPAIANLLGVEIGSQITFVTVVHKPNLGIVNQIKIYRVILKQGAVDDFSTLFTVEATDTIMGIPEGDELSACAVIVSKQVDGKWLRSTETLMLTPNYEREIYNTEAIETAKAGYMKKANASTSDKYLNEGDSKPYGSVSDIYFAGEVVEVGSTKSTTKASGDIALHYTDPSQFDIRKITATGNLSIDLAGAWQTGNDVSFDFTMATGSGTLQYDGQTLLTVTKS